MTTTQPSAPSKGPTRPGQVVLFALRRAGLVAVLLTAVAALIGLDAQPAAATPVPWTLDGVTVAGNGTLSGTYRYDVATNTLSDVNITYTSGGGQTTTFTGRIPNSPISDTAFWLVTDPVGDLTGRTALAIRLFGSMSVGAPHNIGTGGFPRVDTCDNATCSAFRAPARQITGGRVVPGNTGPTITSQANVSVFERRTAAIDVQASDDVDSEGAGLRFAMAGADSALLKLDQTTGLVTFRAAPDFENPADTNTDGVYEIRVRATDSSGFFADQDIRITVADINEPPSTWTLEGVTVAGNGTLSGSYRYIAETNAMSEVNITYTTGGGQQIVFTDRIPGSNLNDRLFWVVTDPAGDLTGRTALVVGLTGPMARGGTHNIGTGGFPRVGICTDATCSGLSSSRRITGGRVTAGTTGPTITSPGTVTAVEGRTMAIDVQATDDIDSEGNGLKYLIGGVDRGLFLIDSQTGVITFRNPPDFENPASADGDNIYQIAVRVLDTSRFLQDQSIRIEVVKGQADWRFDGTTVAGNGRLTGTYRYGATTDTLSDVNITYTSGGGAAVLFTGIVPGSLVNGTGFTAVTDPVGDLTGRLAVAIRLFDPNSGALRSMSNGGTLRIGTGGFPRVGTCDNATCSTFRAPIRQITAGRVIANSVAPTITSPNLVSVPEGQTTILDIEATDDLDSEGNGLLFSIAGGANQSLFAVDANGVVSFATASSPGTYQVVIRVDDSNGLFTDHMLQVKVTSVNRAPTVTPIPAGTVDEGTALTIPVTATDPDGDSITFSGTSLPAFCALNDNGGGTGSVVCNPGSEDAGSYQFTITATDSGTPSRSASVTVEVTVVDVNRAPALAAIADQSTDENTPVPILFNAPDPDGDAVTFTTTAPGFCELFQSPNGEGSLVCRPGFDDAGVYPITVTATDNGTPAQSVSETFNLTVGSTNRPPAVNDIEDKRVDEGVSITIALSGGDIDGDNVQYSVTGSPPGCLLGQDGIRSGQLVCAPGFDDAGVYTITVTATDDGTPNLTDTTTFTLTVVDVNRAPALAAIADQSTDENTSVPILFNAPDPDGDAVTFTTTAPGFCELFQSPNGEGSLVCRPGFDDAGVYPITVTATDNGTPAQSVSETFNLTVGSTNRPPAVNDIEDKRVDEGVALTVLVSGGDIDGNNVRFSADVAPFCTLVNDVNGFGRIECNPGYTDSGIYTVTVTITDDGSPNLTDTDSFTLTVNEINDPPVVDAGADTAVTVPDEIDLSGSVTDDGLPNPPAALSYQWSVVSGPGTVSFDDPTSLSTSATFSAGGTFTLRLSVDDGLTVGFDEVEITVNNPLGCTIIGTDGPDELVGTDGADVICGFRGSDEIDGGGGDDVIHGGLGNDEIEGGAGEDTINGDGGRDEIYGGDDADIINGGSGNDRIFGEEGNDILDGGADRDRIFGGEGNDILQGRRDNDNLQGGEGDDQMFGGSGNDRLQDSLGTNIFDGGPGRDRCIDEDGSTSC